MKRSGSIISCWWDIYCTAVVERRTWNQLSSIMDNPEAWSLPHIRQIILWTSVLQPWSTGPNILHVLDLSLLHHTWLDGHQLVFQGLHKSVNESLIRARCVWEWRLVKHAGPVGPEHQGWRTTLIHYCDLHWKFQERRISMDKVICQRLIHLEVQKGLNHLLYLL